TLRSRTVSALFCRQLAVSQPSAFRVPDSLKNKSIDYLINRLESNNSEARLIYGYTYLHKAKLSGDYESIMEAYKALMYMQDKKVWLTYCDTIVRVAASSMDDRLIGSAYLTKGTVYNYFRKPRKALDNFLLANNHIVKVDDQ